jgi:hypothetical protein
VYLPEDFFRVPSSWPIHTNSKGHSVSGIISLQLTYTVGTDNTPSPGIKRLNRSPSFNAKFRNAWSFTSTPLYDSTASYKLGIKPMVTRRELNLPQNRYFSIYISGTEVKVKSSLRFN